MSKINSFGKNIHTFTYTNIISNGNFLNGTTGWSTYNTTAFTAANNISRITSNLGDTEANLQQVTNIVAGVNRKIYASAMVTAISSGIASIDIRTRGETGGIFGIISQANPIQNMLYRLSGVIDFLDTNTGNLTIWIRQINIPSTAGKIIEIKEIFAIDLTALFGAGNEPSAVDCANIFKFVDGTKQPSFSEALMV